MRSTEQQLWPVLYIAPSASDSAAAAGFASSQTYVGSLPPSSSWSRIIRAPTAAAIFAPVPAEPVKNTPSTGCASSATPVSPVPTRVMKTSAGTPAWWSSRAMCRPVRVAYSDGL